MKLSRDQNENSQHALRNVTLDRDALKSQKAWKDIAFVSRFLSFESNLGKEQHPEIAAVREFAAAACQFAAVSKS